MNQRGQKSALVVIQAYDDRNGPSWKNVCQEKQLQKEVKDSHIQVKSTPFAKGSETASKSGSPPPPPPLPSSQQSRTSVNSLSGQGKNSLKKPPSSPIPDYDSSSLSSTNSSTITNSNFKMHFNTSNRVNNTIIKSSLSSSTTSKTVHVINKTPKAQAHSSSNMSDIASQKVGDSVEMESIESFKLTNPPGPPPKPPATYFATEKKKKPASPSTSTSSSEKVYPVKKDRPVSVIIGEYPSGVERRQPNKFDFLLSSATDGKPTGISKTDNMPINNLLQNELAQTLSRSNLKKRTESNENLMNGTSAPEKTGNGTVTISINSQPINGSNLNIKQNLKSKPQNQLNTSLSNSNYINSNNYDKKIPLFNGDIKNNVKPAILQAAEKLSSTMGKNSVTIIVSNKNEDNIKNT